jgi:hypothetical protein
MTPLIAEMVNVVPPDIVADMVWFDIHEAWNEKREAFTHDRSIVALQNPLPFHKCAIVGITEHDDKFVLMALDAVRPEAKDSDTFGLAVSGFIKRGGTWRILPPFFCDPRGDDTFKKDGLTIHFEDGRNEQDENALHAARSCLVAISFWLELLNAEKIPVYTPIKKSSHAKRIRQGKKPMFDWHTVVLEPRSVKSEYLGGTHSSPRLHDVRGHWVVRGNKKFWRKPHKRGDASKGVIFHDYKLKGEKHDHV